MCVCVCVCAGRSSLKDGRGGEDIDAVDAYELTGCMSLLVRPKLVWKAERQQQRAAGAADLQVRHVQSSERLTDFTIILRSTGL